MAPKSKSHDEKQEVAGRIGAGLAWVVLGLILLASMFPVGAKAQAPTPNILFTGSEAQPQPDGDISLERREARVLFRALTSVNLPIDDERLQQMESLLRQAKTAPPSERSELRRQAAAIATADRLFYDLKVRDIAKRMSNREESIRVPLNDFAATFVGVVRDSDTTSAKQLLTGNFTYRGPANGVVAGVQVARPVDTPANQLANLVASNNHYADLERTNQSLKDVLVRVEGQLISTSTAAAPGTPVLAAIPTRDVAGLITTRAFLNAHAVAGTNRRLVEYTFKQFLCVEMTDWSNTEAPDQFVSQDVNRMPAGSASAFHSTCKACHGQMDALRPAFTRFDWVEGGAGRARYYTNIGELPGAANNPGSTWKYTQNRQIAPEGHDLLAPFRAPNGVVPEAQRGNAVPNSFSNFAASGKNAQLFGWRGQTSGQGLADYGAMIAESRGFSECMVRRVFEGVCRRKLDGSENRTLASLTDQFESDGHHLRRLFERIATHEACKEVL